MVSNPEDKRWPDYHDAPRDATFALGVIGTGYARLEWVFAAVFAATIDLRSAFTWSLLPKINNDVRVKLIEEALPVHGYGPDVEDRIMHFLAAYKSLAFNRNMLMHSHISSGGATTSILFKTQRDGKTVACQVPLAQLREIADQMQAYRVFGRALANHISMHRDGVLLFPEGIAPFPLPDKPSLPSRLEYTSDPIRYR